MKKASRRIEYSCSPDFCCSVFKKRKIDYLSSFTKLTKASSPQVLAEMCQSGYKDALRFLEENSESCSHRTFLPASSSLPTVLLMTCFVAPDLLMLEHPTAGPTLLEPPPTCCHEHTETTKEWLLRRLRLLRKQHWWLDEQIALPTPIKKGTYSKISAISEG